MVEQREGESEKFLLEEVSASSVCPRANSTPHDKEALGFKLQVL